MSEQRDIPLYLERRTTPSPSVIVVARHYPKERALFEFPEGLCCRNVAAFYLGLFLFCFVLFVSWFLYRVGCWNRLAGNFNAVKGS